MTRVREILSENKINRFWSRIEKKDSGCWLYKGSLNRGGYGYLEIKGKKYMAHRIAYELHHGVAPDKLCVCHSCDNPTCCNPDHLWLGTQTENHADMTQKGRGVQLKGEANVKSKLTTEAVIEIRTSNLTNKQLGEKFGISESVVSAARRGETWKHLNLMHIPETAVRCEAVVEEEYDCPEDHACFVGACTCEHTPEQHGWGSCDVEGCMCEAGWEE